VPKIRISAESQAALFEAGLKILSISQPSWLFPKDGRKLTRCAVDSDPWHAVLCDHSNALMAKRFTYGSGQTAEAAVLAAIGERSNFGPLEAEIDKLLATLRSTR
jgi:hypothetical protein